MSNKDVYTTDYTTAANITPLESEILVQYQKLAIQLKNLSQEIESIISQPTTELLENLRTLETKIGLVFTLFKGAVYSLFLQQENLNDMDQDMNQANHTNESTSDFQY